MWEEEREELEEGKEEDGGGWLQKAQKHSEKKNHTEIPACCIIFFTLFVVSQLFFSRKIRRFPREARDPGCSVRGRRNVKKSEPPWPFYLLNLANERV